MYQELQSKGRGGVAGRRPVVAGRAAALAAMAAMAAITMFCAVPPALGDSPKRSVFPTADNIGPPFYARVEFDGVVHTDIVPNDGTWAALVFYRGPDCIPRDFNLRQFFDLPGPTPGGFHPGFLVCAGQLNVRGFEVWRTAPLADVAPKQAQFFANPAVPVWFVRWRELEPVARTGVLTMASIEDAALMPSLRRGVAHAYHEVLHPTGGAVRPSLTIVASGVLEDGTAFRLRHVGNAGGRRTEIRFGE